MIYYVEDDAAIRDLTLYTLRRAGLEAQGFASAGPFFDAVEQSVPDLVLLDIMLPGMDGLAVLERVRGDARTRDVPVMMLTAKGTEYDKVVGLDAGADDYLAKPFGMMELVSRCNALLRRASRPGGGAGPEAAACSCGRISINPLTREAFAEGVGVELTLKEFELLLKLVENQGRAFTRAQLLEDIWDITYVGETRTVDTHIQTLRRKLNEASPGAGDMVKTVRGVGYRIRCEEQE
ncbi:MAG: response regulator transcription factor [Coriobacteriaceae bacterium]|nr:response regulator transcription factor [Coriobacteriaceae bacterium]